MSYKRRNLRILKTLLRHFVAFLNRRVFVRRAYFVPEGAVLRAFRKAPSISLRRLHSHLDANQRQDPTPRA